MPLHPFDFSKSGEVLASDAVDREPPFLRVGAKAVCDYADVREAEFGSVLESREIVRRLA
jgi:hypothetical protein